jgi:hypothetical protein
MASPTDDNDDRRRFPRVAVETTNLRLAMSGEQPKVRIDRIVDFSLGGLLIELHPDEPTPKVGGLLDVALEWPGGAQRFDASVRRVADGDEGKKRVGVEFDDPELVSKLMGTWYRSVRG